MLLVAEQARELVELKRRVTTVAAPGLRRSAQERLVRRERRMLVEARAVTPPEAIYEVVRRNGGSIRVPGEQLVTRAAVSRHRPW